LRERAGRRRRRVKAQLLVRGEELTGDAGGWL
jgi:hypothetical protein